MNFVSLEYGLLLISTWLLYWVLPWHRARLVLLLTASYAFYMAWNPKLVALLWFSTLLDYACGRAVSASSEPRLRRLWLTLSLVGNLGVLGLFKYYGFFVDSAIAVLSTLGFAPHERTLQLILPLGISFYTFQSMSYTLDIYRGVLRPHKSLLEFSVFVAFFPQLVAGPIVRARDFLHQLTARRELRWAEIQWGIERILVGLIKKAVIADNLAPVVDQIFANGAGTTSTHAWVGSLLFYGQVYCDFSGYSDIAIGSARLFGLRVKENFLQPYLATSPSEYWNRWHVSLNTWLRDYVYFPLGGNRVGATRVHVNLFLTFFLSGLWHGAAWTYAFWGAYHGLCLIVHRLWSRSGHSMPWLPALIAQVLFTCFGYFMFRAESWQNMMDMMSAALQLPTSLPDATELRALAIAASVFLIEPMGARARQLCETPRFGAALRGLLIAAGVALLVVGMAADVQDFVYFVF